MNIRTFAERKKRKEKISMVTCYDSSSAKIVSRSNIDTILVGDSVAMTMHGHDNTIPADIDLMTTHTRAVAKSSGDKFVIGDLPFLATRKSLHETMNAVEKLMKAGAHAVKLEGLIGQENHIQHIVQAGVPVMGHLGLTPQSLHQLGGFRTQGRQKEEAQTISAAARRLEELGCFALVLECIPSTLARQITLDLAIPTIGIGAGPFVDGQVLVWHDLLGLNSDFRPKFAKAYCDAQSLFEGALNEYDREVKALEFPKTEEKVVALS